MNLILLESGEVGQGGRVHLAGARAAHLIHVLGVVPGQTVRVGVLNGPSGVGTVRGVSPGAVDLHCALDSKTPPRPRIDLLLAVPRPKVLRRLFAQIAALGVGRVILTNAERVERAYFDTHVVTPECYRPLLIEGLQQARDTALPEVTVHRRFRILVEDELDQLAGPAIRLVADPGAEVSAGAVARARLAGAPDSRVLVAIGPEGGWNPFELEHMEAHGFCRVGMGARTLRADTACVALLALIHDAVPRPA
jgi:16S rRNA (uracil1498-N3)-methyltransferase